MTNHFYVRKWDAAAWKQKQLPVKLGESKKDNYNDFHNLWRLFAALPNFPFTTVKRCAIITCMYWFHTTEISNQSAMFISFEHQIFLLW